MRDVVFQRLNERSKELNCLYNVIELFQDKESTLSHIFRRLCVLIPPGWQFTSVCEVRIAYECQEYKSDEFYESKWVQSADIIVDNNVTGKIEVFYTQLIREVNDNQFLPEEQKLLNTIAGRLGDYLFTRKLNKTIEFLTEQEKEITEQEKKEILSSDANEHWKWRFQMAEIISDKLDFEKFGVKAVYLIGSTKNAEAGPKSDIDFLIHVENDKEKVNLLKAWISGWSFCLAEMNFLKTGYQSPSGLIDLHLITDEDIKKKTSYAVMIGCVYNSARLLKSKFMV